MMPPSADTYGRLRLAVMGHDAGPDDYDEVMDGWRSTDRDADVSFEDLPEDVQQLIEGLEASASTMTPQAELHYRLGDTMSRDMDSGDQDAIRDAYLEAGGDDATWDDLPQDTQDLIQHVEDTVPRTAWDDPADAPDDTSYMDDDIEPADIPNPPYVVPVDEAAPPDDQTADAEDVDDEAADAIDDDDEETPAARSVEMTDDEIRRAFGHDTTPGHNQLKHYWLAGPGLAKWAETEDPWTDLHAELSKYLPPEEAKKTASQWFHDHFGFWPGSDLNRVTHGHPPRGKVVGPG